MWDTYAALCSPSHSHFPDLFAIVAQDLEEPVQDLRQVVQQVNVRHRLQHQDLTQEGDRQGRSWPWGVPQRRACRLPLLLFSVQENSSSDTLKRSEPAGKAGNLRERLASKRNLGVSRDEEGTPSASEVNVMGSGGRAEETCFGIMCHHGSWRGNREAPPQPREAHGQRETASGPDLTQEMMNCRAYWLLE